MPNGNKPKVTAVIEPPVPKGCIRVGNGEKHSRFHVGSDGKILSANSAQPQGVEWIDPPSGVGSAAIKQVEVDFGSVPVMNKQFVIADTDVSISNKIIAGIAYESDDAEWFEDVKVMARAGNDQVVLYCKSPYADIDGLCKINYLIG